MTMTQRKRDQTGAGWPAPRGAGKEGVRVNNRFELE
ncbi:hypothetical protein APTSU1_000901000 [Apodemus speciosus]|uniref:Uncharacterized protein n=1 Tax=Apodemus speciosus TaxID=105296 RepID=A0ABQ0F3B7_APOSI